MDVVPYPKGICYLSAAASPRLEYSNLKTAGRNPSRRQQMLRYFAEHLNRKSMGVSS